MISNFANKNYRKFTDDNLEKLCPWSLASTIPVLGLEKVCPENLALGQGCRNPGGGGIYSPFDCISPNNLLWSAFERWMIFELIFLVFI